MRFSTLLTGLSALVAIVSASPAPAPEAEAVPPHLAYVQKRAWADLYTKCTTPKTVALTFDDGPYIYHTQLVNVLAQYNAKATFFVNGNNWVCGYRDDIITMMRAGFAAGHVYGSHTWRHLHLANQTWDRIHDEMYKTELLLNRVLGVQPAMMRPPYGEYNDLVRSASGTRNQSMILWDFDSGDSTGSTATQSIQLYTDFVNSHANSTTANLLALNHEVYNTTVNTVIPKALDLLSKAGYKFVTVDQCLGIQPYQWTQPQGVKDPATWVC